MIVKIYPTLFLAFIFLTGTMSSEAMFTWNSKAESFIGGPPTATVCGKTKGEVNKNDLLEMKSIELRGCVESAKVTGFKMSVVRQNKDGSDKVISLTALGNSLTEKMKGLIKGTPSGSKIYFENIDVEDSNGKKYDIEPVVVTIG